MSPVPLVPNASCNFICFVHGAPSVPSPQWPWCPHHPPLSVTLLPGALGALVPHDSETSFLACPVPAVCARPPKVPRVSRVPNIPRVPGVPMPSVPLDNETPFLACLASAAQCPACALHMPRALRVPMMPFFPTRLPAGKKRTTLLQLSHRESVKQRLETIENARKREATQGVVRKRATCFVHARFRLCC